MVDDEILTEFLVECHENLDQLDQDLVTLEADPSNPEILSRIFRTIHTIKGTCGFLAFTKLEWVTHVGENLLSRMREGELQLNGEITTALLSLVDAVREILGSLETTGKEGAADYAPLVATLTRLHESSQRTTEVPSSAATEPSPGPLKTEPPARAATTEATVDMLGTPRANAHGPPQHAFSSTQSSTTELSDGEASLAAGEHPSGSLDQRVEQFLMESYEHADQLDRDLVTLEADPSNPELLLRIFGTLHTLKSSSGFLGFTATESASHAGESLLSRLRDGSCQLNPEITTALLALVDTVRQTLVAIETTGKEGEADYASLVKTFGQLEAASEVAVLETPKAAAIQQETAQARPHVTGDAPRSLAARAQSVADTSIRVDVRLLDMLMDQVGELVLARNRIMQFATIQEDRSLLTAYQRLDLITSELQEGVMRTRMQPIGTIWNKFPRVVRDLARECGKKVDLIMEGEETELDRTLIEAIRDPLTHLVRNAVDHGFEKPEARLLAGKSETGQLSLRAFHEGGQVIVEIADDGGGIDPQRIVRRAMERNLITATQAAQISQGEIIDLLFKPGFSTAEIVTNVSGRGVGMDVVKNNIERINGTIDVQSQVGKGSTIQIRIPLTLAIIPALIIRCAGDRYAIPQASLLELVRLEGDGAGAKIETIQGAPVYRLRGRLLPLVYLHEALPFETGASNQEASQANHVVNIVVLQADGRQFGLVVEKVLDTEEIVVKPLGKQVKDIAEFSGATIMGDGKVALILDVLGLAHRARVVSERRDSLQTDTSARDLGQATDRQTLLLFESAEGQRMALPLSRVTRLEKFQCSAIEKTGPYDVVQYWGQVMPLIHLSKCLAAAETWSSPTATDDSQRDNLEVVVLTMQSRSIGLVVNRIFDTVDDVFDIQPIRSREGVLGTVVVQGKVTELLDLDEIIEMANPALFAQLASMEAEA